MIPDNTILVSFVIVNMYPSIDDDRGIAAVRNALETKVNKSPSTDCIIEGLEICLKCNNSRFGSINLLQLNGTATGAPNSCLYADLAVFNIDKNLLQAKRNPYQKMKYFDQYRDDCPALWTGPLEKIDLVLTFLNSIDSNLQFDIEADKNELCFLDLRLTLKDNKIRLEFRVNQPIATYIYKSFTLYFRNTKRSCFKIMQILFNRRGV